MRKYLVLQPALSGWYVRGCYGLALLDMAREAASKIDGSILISAATDRGAGATISRMPAGYETVPNQGGAN